MKVKWKEYFNKYNPAGSELEVLAVSLNSLAPNGVSVKVFMKLKSGKEKENWVSLDWFDVSEFPNSYDTYELIPLKDIDMS